MADEAKKKSYMAWVFTGIVFVTSTVLLVFGKITGSVYLGIIGTLQGGLLGVKATSIIKNGG